MTTIDHVTSQISEKELATVSGGMEMADPLNSGGGSGSSGGTGGLVDLAGIGAYATAGPAGYLIYQGGVGIGVIIKDWMRGRK
jgi:bacteriocin-like protein